MKRIFTFLSSVLICTMVMAQAPTGVIKKASVAPIIDGQIDAVWSEANVYNIDKNFTGELPTLGNPGQTTWQALWTDDGIYVLIKVADDNFWPAYLNGRADYLADKPEIYFDVNTDYLKDGKGVVDGLGHYMVNPTFTQDKIDGTELSTLGVRYAFLVNDPTYVGEYFIPFSKLISVNGFTFDKSQAFGFDVCIIDADSYDPATIQRKRAMWSNIGTVNEDYQDMDDAGTVTLEGGQATVYVESVTITGGTTIVTDQGTLQLAADVKPDSATNKTVNWTVVNETGKAAISSTGLLLAIQNGTVTVRAAAIDGSYLDGSVEITISGQTGNTALPTPWKFNDVGNPGVAGSAIFIGGEFTISGSGSDIWNTADQFSLISVDKSGDGSISGRITAPSTLPTGKSGLMFRETLDPDSKFVDLVLNGSAVWLQWRDTKGGAADYKDISASSFPIYLKLERSDSTFSAYTSLNGTDWGTALATHDVDFSSDAKMGIAQVSGNDAALAEVKFDNIFVDRIKVENKSGISVFTTQIPTNFGTDAATECGMKFTSATAGKITKLRFYKGPLETGTNTCHLWSENGTELANIVFSDETAEGWQEVAIPPVSIDANTVYVVSVNFNTQYPYMGGELATSVVNGPLSSVADGTNGVYNRPIGVFPDQTYNNSNYYVDVVFEETTGVKTLSNNTMKVFPNPVCDGNLTIQFSSNVKNGIVQVIDLSGKVLSQRNIMNENRLNMNIGNLSKGIYLLKVANENSIQTSKLIVK